MSKSYELIVPLIMEKLSLQKELLDITIRLQAVNLKLAEVERDMEYG